MKNNWRRILIIAAVGIALVCCLSVGLFAWWANQPENVASFQADDTAQAYKNATQTTQAGKDAASATQQMAAIADRLQKATPVFNETFDTNNAFLKKNIGDLNVSMTDGVPDISIPFNAYHVWSIGKDVHDFVAELDCAAEGDGSFCGIAYNLQPKDQKPDSLFYASYTSAGGQCGFDDLTGSFSVTKGWSCSAPPSPAAGSLNRLRVERFGQHLRFYVNGQLMDDRVLPVAQTGGVGIYFGRSSDNNSGNFHVMIANFKVSELP